MKVTLYIVAILMIGITSVGFDEGFARFLFASGSDGLMSFVVSELYMQIILLKLFVLLIIFIKKCKKYIWYYPMLATLFCLWLLSGRMIALFPDGRLMSGWFYMETKRVLLCKEEGDCEQVFYYETVAKKTSFWTYRITNNNVNTTVYTGPFIASEVNRLFSDIFPSSPK